MIQICKSLNKINSEYFHNI